MTHTSMCVPQQKHDLSSARCVCMWNRYVLSAHIGGRTDETVLWWTSLITRLFSDDRSTQMVLWPIATRKAMLTTCSIFEFSQGTKPLPTITILLCYIAWGGGCRRVSFLILYIGNCHRPRNAKLIALLLTSFQTCWPFLVQKLSAKLTWPFFSVPSTAMFNVHIWVFSAPCCTWGAGGVLPETLIFMNSSAQLLTLLYSCRVTGSKLIWQTECATIV